MECPKCKSKNTIDTVRYEGCKDCGWYFYYGDAHAPNLEDRLSSGSDYHRQRGDSKGKESEE